MTDEQQALFAKAHRMLKTARLSLEDAMPSLPSTGPITPPSMLLRLPC